MQRDSPARDSAVERPGPAMSDFTGGPEELFDAAGREQLAALLDHGLVPASRVVDLGCGALRGGRWVIPILDAGNYFGVEPNREMLDRGLSEFVDPEMLRIKHPRFSNNDSFDLSEFDTRFTHFLLRSIWTHASKLQIRQCLDAFVSHSTPDAVMLTSRISRSIDPRRGLSDYRGSDWRGRSHESSSPGMVAHSLRWIRGEARQRRLTVARSRRPPVGGQHWLVIRHGASS